MASSLTPGSSHLMLHFLLFFLIEALAIQMSIFSADIPVSTLNRNYHSKRTMPPARQVKSSRFRKAASKNQKPAPDATTTDLTDPILKEKFERSIEKNRHKIIRNKINSFHGKNYVVSYRQEFGFEQQWQDKEDTASSSVETGFPSSKFYNNMSSILYLVFILSCFVTNIDYFFKTKGPRDFYTAIYCLTIVAFLSDGLIRLGSYLSSKAEAYYQKMQMLDALYLQVLGAVYFVIKIMDIPQRKNAGWALIQVAVTLLIIHSIKRIQHAYRFLRFLLNIENQAKIAELLISLIIVLHIMATVFKVSTYPYPNNNWLTYIENIDYQNQFSVYLRAFYFATTTILTVGYGDISPKNDLQIGIVTIVEITGIIIFAYMINQIGYSMSNIRKENEAIDKDLSNVEKIKRHYKMNESTTNRLRSFIINQKPSGELVEPQEERQLMTRLNQGLRKEVEKQNYLAILKTSMFFLIRWSKHFQKVVADNLIHTIFSPNELIYQPEGKERIYIIRVGKVNIYAERSQLRRGANNVLKTINAELGEESFDNTYGWTAVLSSRPSRLYAYAKDYTSAYSIEKPQFQQASNASSYDHQYYHEIKDRINQSSCWEAIELPVLQSCKHHYNPTKYVVLRRLKQGNVENKRTHVKRRPNKSNNSSLIRAAEEGNRARRKITVLMGGSEQVMTGQSLKQIRPEASIMKQTTLEVIVEQSPESHSTTEVSPIIADFESGKEYANYFSRHNRDTIMAELERVNFVPCPRFKRQINQSFNKTLQKISSDCMSQ